MIAEILRHLLWRDRVAAAHAERDAARRDAAERFSAVQRILDQAATLPDQNSPQARRAA